MCYRENIANPLGIVLGLGCLAASSPSLAQVTIAVQGTLAPSCALEFANKNFNNLVLTSSGSQTIPFVVDCNAPFAYALVSSNGGFKNPDAFATITPGSRPFAETIPYKISTSFATDSGSFGDKKLDSATITPAYAAPCLAASFSSACPFANSGSGAAAAGLGASITIDWVPPSDAPLLAGTYSDTITLTVRVRS